MTNRANVSKKKKKKKNLKHPLLSWQLVEIYNSLKSLKIFAWYCSSLNRNHNLTEIYTVERQPTGLTILFHIL